MANRERKKNEENFGDWFAKIIGYYLTAENGLCVRLIVIIVSYTQDDRDFMTTAGKSHWKKLRFTTTIINHYHNQ